MNNEFIENAKLTDEDLNQVSGGTTSRFNWPLIQKNIPNVKPQTSILESLNIAIGKKDLITASKTLLHAVGYYEHLGIDLYAQLGIRP